MSRAITLIVFGGLVLVASLIALDLLPNKCVPPNYNLPIYEGLLPDEVCKITVKPVDPPHGWPPVS